MSRILLGTAAAIGMLAAIQAGAAATGPGAAPGQRIFEVFFDFDKSDLTAAALKVIRQAADSALAGHSAELSVTGHTDTVGTAIYNQALSERRAAAVKAQLIADGVPAAAITATGVGKTGLLVQTGDGVREPQNRRVEIAGAAPAEIAAAPPPPPPAPPAPAGCSGTVDPYKNYACLDKYLGSGFFERLYNYYRLEWGESGPPTDPNAPPGRRDYWPATPENTPPISFTEWPHGAVTPIGVTRPNSVDSPLMTALGDEGFGAWMQENDFQIYGWVDPGINISSNTVRPGGNAPIAYIYTPNTIQLDQFVLYLDRFPDTVQTDHIDWGMRLSAIYGENYRYTTAYGIASYQLLKDNKVNGYDFPMAYFDLFVPQIAEGLELRVGRYISIPDIEAQLAPNNYMYTHSITYSWDNYTNEGIVATLAVTKNLQLQLGVNVGTEAPPWHVYQQITNPYPNVLFPGKTFPKDPGSMPSLTACVRYVTDDGNTDIYPCMDGINRGTWGYNNLQWYGTTFYHKWSDQWHIATEFYTLWENHVPNSNNSEVNYIFAHNGTPFSPQFTPFNAPGLASCHSASTLTCRAKVYTALAYLNYTPGPLDNISLRPEYYYDAEGQRTGTRTPYYEIALGWQHWLSPQLEFRPEVAYYRSIAANAFNGDANAGIAPDKNYTVEGSMDMIFHF